MGRHVAGFGRDKTFQGACVGARIHICGTIKMFLVTLAVLPLSLKAAQVSSCTVKTRALPANGQLYTDSLDSGCQLQMELVPDPGCNNTSFLHVEVWDLHQLFSGQEDLIAGSSIGSRADPLLGIAQGSVPNASFKTSGSWDVSPAQAIFDTKGYELMHPYMHVQSSYGGVITNGSWYISLQNLDSWTSGSLDFQIRATCSQEVQCPAPLLDPTDGTPLSCSGAGHCIEDGRCSCNAGTGDVGCSKSTPTLGWGVEEAHTLSSADWMYWELLLEQDADAILVQLTRTAGDPVLFLKAQSEGFQVGRLQDRLQKLFLLLFTLPDSLLPACNTKTGQLSPIWFRFASYIECAWKKDGPRET